jgi:hypothetical protein
MDSNGHRPRLAWAGTLAGALALAGCGGGEEEAARQTLPAGVAQELARASEDVAESVEAGDFCGAAEEAEELRSSALAAVDDGRVPEGLAEPLLAAVERLEGQIECVETSGPGQSQDDEQDPPGKAKGKDKNKDKDEGDDDGEDEDEDEPPDGTTTEETPTEETPTETTPTETGEDGR